MNNKNSKYWYICVSFIIFVGLLSSGCFQLKKPSFFNRESNDVVIDKDDRIDALEEKVANLTYSLGNLTTENYELKKNFNQLEKIENKLNDEYTQIKNKQSALEKTRTEDNNERNSLKRGLTDANNSLNEIKQQLSKIEAEKNKLKARLEEIESLEMQTIQTNLAINDTIKVETENIDPNKSKENLIKETQEKRKSSLVDDLLNKAIKLYREGNFEEAIAKWEEVLVLDPSKMEAKFNIEIAHDRIKEQQIQEDLKSNRTQRE